jgi:ABC-type cobalamin transport system permease subunit
VTTVLAAESTGWVIGYSIAIAVVLVVVALVVPILLLARRIGDQAQDIDDALNDAVHHTSALADLHTTIDAAGVIVAGLERGRARLGG